MCLYKFVFIIQSSSPVFHCLQLFLNLRTNHLEEQVAKNMTMMITENSLYLLEPTIHPFGIWLLLYPYLYVKIY